MLVIKVEVWPGGVEGASYEIGRARIWNDLTNEYRPIQGNYKVELKTTVARRVSKGIWKRGEVKNFVRDRSVWSLLCYALLSCLKSSRQLSKKRVGEILG